uniref:transposase n=1 Tax=Corynebacterium auriscanis TaxID=99807 RepID=UPI0022473D41|nr:transposase [Corynebacterium auriscanis]
MTVWRRREDVLAYFDIGASNGPVEAINGRLEHRRGTALGVAQPQQRHRAVPNSLRAAAHPDQRTLKREEPESPNRLGRLRLDITAVRVSFP